MSTGDQLDKTNGDLKKYVYFVESGSLKLSVPKEGSVSFTQLCVIYKFQ